jgi:hypothetical protein
MVCTRVRDTSPDRIIPGSKPDGRCKLCGEKVWRSPSTRQMRRRVSAVHCSACVRDTLDGTETVMPLTKAQIAELRAHVGRWRQ